MSVPGLLDSPSALNVMAANIDLLLVRGVHPQASDSGVEQDGKVGLQPQWVNIGWIIMGGSASSIPLLKVYVASSRHCKQH